MVCTLISLIVVSPIPIAFRVQLIFVHVAGIRHPHNIPLHYFVWGVTSFGGIRATVYQIDSDLMTLVSELVLLSFQWYQYIVNLVQSNISTA